MCNKIQTPELSVVIPLYREGAHLSTTLSEIIQVLKPLNIIYEIVLVDDGSTDDTWQVMLNLHEIYPQISCLRLSRNFGKEAALAAGLTNARGNAICVMDGDLQHPPKLIPEMIELWRNGAEVVEAVKSHRGQETLASRIQAQLFYSVFTRLTGLDLRGASDFKLMDHRVLDAWFTMNERNLFFRGMNAWLGFRRVQVLFEVEDRIDGESNWSLISLIRLAITAVTTFSSAPIYLLLVVGLGFSVFAVLLGLETLYMKFSGQAVNGFTTVILLLLIIGGAIMLGLGLIGIYIGRIFEEVKNRPRYVVAEQVE